MTLPMRVIFLVGGGFVLLAGIQLYAFGERTEDLFAWTIEPPLTAALLGSFYLGACVLAFASGREPLWDHARVGVPGVLAFVWLTLVATLLDLDKFHLDDDRFIPALAAWIWLAVYALEPPVLTVVYALQLRASGGDSELPADLPGWFRGVAAALGALLALLGAVLFIAPERADDLWPWKLTPLTARATAAWLVGEGLLGVMIARESSWERVRWAVLSLLALGVLLAAAPLFYPDTLESGGAGTAYLIAVAVFIVGGAYGSAQAFRARRSAA